MSPVGCGLQSTHVTEIPNGCPVPVMFTTVGVLTASLLIVTAAAPPSIPATGENVTVTVALPPLAANVAGTPLTEYPSPAGSSVFDEMLAVCSPVLVSVKVSCLVVPSRTLPNASSDVL